jgi:hypothetical protein
VIFSDDLGEPVPAPVLPTAVVSLVPSLTEAVAATVPDILVGATDYCVHPADLKVTRIGGSKYPKVDDVLALKPDLVLANQEENRAEDVGRLRANGVPVWVTAAPATVPAALASLRRLLTQGLGAREPGWLVAAENAWCTSEPIWTTAIVPVWRRPWIVLGRETFAGDVLRRLGVANAYADHEDRYPRPKLTELQQLMTTGQADLLVLPDEPYAFSRHDGPEMFPQSTTVLLSGRALTWWGPSLVAARAELTAALATIR